VIVREAGVGDVVFVRVKVAVRPAVAEVTVKLPADEFVVSVGAVAIPLVLVTTCAVAELLKVPHAPPEPLFAVKVTVTPDSAAPD
jgi:hypothetical protein